NKDTAQRFNGSSRDSAGRTERFDGRNNQSDRGQNCDGVANRDQSGARGGAGQDRMGNRDIPNSDRGRQGSAFSGSDSRGTKASSDRGFSSQRQSGGGFGGGGGA